MINLERFMDYYNNIMSNIEKYEYSKVYIDIIHDFRYFVLMKPNNMIGFLNHVSKSKKNAHRGFFRPWEWFEVYKSEPMVFAYIMENFYSNEFQEYLDSSKSTGNSNPYDYRHYRSNKVNYNKGIPYRVTPDKIQTISVKMTSDIIFKSINSNRFDTLSSIESYYQLKSYLEFLIDNFNSFKGIKNFYQWCSSAIYLGAFNNCCPQALQLFILLKENDNFKSISCKDIEKTPNIMFIYELLDISNRGAKLVYIKTPSIFVSSYIYHIKSNENNLKSIKHFTRLLADHLNAKTLDDMNENKYVDYMCQLLDEPDSFEFSLLTTSGMYPELIPYNLMFGSLLKFNPNGVEVKNIISSKDSGMYLYYNRAHTGEMIMENDEFPKVKIDTEKMKTCVSLKMMSYFKNSDSIDIIKS